MTAPTKPRSAPPADRDIDLDAIAWQFLCSDYATKSYVQWPLDRRLQAYLDRDGLTEIANNGRAYATVFDRVMRSIGLAINRGVLPSPHPRPAPLTASTA